MRSRNAVCIVTVVAGLALLVGCNARVHEPWVPNANLLKQERARSAAQMKGLQERLMMVQTDR